MSRVRGWLADAAGRSAALLLRAIGRSATTLPGRIAVAIDPRAIARLSSRLSGGVAVISATNGKTTTANLAAAALRSSGRSTIHNAAGANLASGVASSLLSRGAKSDPGATGLFEVDEFWLPGLTKSLVPSVVLLGNLFRDQLDRYGEMDSIALRWKEMTRRLSAAGCRFVICADDPVLASIGLALPTERVDWFGVETTEVSLARLPHSADSTRCPRCDGQLDYTAILLGHLGHWHCTGCDLKRPEPSFSVTHFVDAGDKAAQVTIRCPSGSFEVELPLSGLYNSYNACGAFALAQALGCPAGEVVKGLEAATPAFGRGEVFRISGRPATMLLIKNPTGADQALRSIPPGEERTDLVIGLNDAIADGRDVSWIWDTDFELLAHRDVRIWCTGRRAGELALRLKYAGVGIERILIVTDPLDAVQQAADGGEGRFWILPTYTAMFHLRERLVELGVAEAL